MEDIQQYRAKIYQQNDETLQKTSDIQDKALKSSNRAKAEIYQTEKVGIETREKLFEQGDQMVSRCFSWYFYPLSLFLYSEI
jgi:hypothetical protein